MASDEVPPDVSYWVDEREKWLEITSGVVDPDENPEAWDIFRDLIDPLVDKLEGWLDRPVESVTDITALEAFDPSPNWNRPDQHYTNAWDRARVELDACQLGSSNRSLEEQLARLARRSRDFAKEWKKLSVEDGGGWLQVKTNVFALDLPPLR